MATTYSGSSSNQQAGVRTVLETCTTGTEAAPATGASAGLPLQGLKGFNVSVEAHDGVTNLTAGSLKAYLQNPITGKWSPCPDLDKTVAGGAVSQAYTTTPLYEDAGALAYVPSGLGTAVDVYINGR